MDIINPSIKTLDDLKEFGLTVLAVVPKVKDEGAIAKQRKKDLLVYAVGVTGLCISLAFFVIEFLNLGLMDKVIRKINYLIG